MPEPTESLDFIRSKVKADLEAGAYPGVVTRFPPEPNGYLHVGHAKAICADFGIAADYGGRCNLRFDDTNPATEEREFVESIQADIRWLGFEWGGEPLHASEYFKQIYDYAEALISKGLAYVDSSTEDEVRELRGTVTEPGRRSSYAERTVEENLALFRRMAAGEFAEGEHVLRARIDMANANMKMRDPLIYRIKHAKHHHTGDDWHVYPLYDFAHCLSDYIEGVTHSMCTLEFDVNRAIYDWFLEQLTEGPRPHQYEFARLELTYIITSKRRLKALVDEGRVSGWDDPRMPTLAGMRRLGYPPEAIRALMARVGISKSNSLVEYGWLEDAVREQLNTTAPRALAVLRPLKLVITNWEGGDTTVDVPTWPQHADRDECRAVPFGRELWIDQEDFEEVPPLGWKRLAPGREVRLRSAFLVTCDSVIMKDGEVVEVRCTADLDSRGGRAPDGRKVRGTIHWVPVNGAVDAEVRLYDRLFADEVPGEGKESVFDSLNPKSLEVLTAKVEPTLATAAGGERFQFERLGYFTVDSSDPFVFNRTVTLRDSWAKAKPTARKARGVQGPTVSRAPLPAAAQGLVNRHGIADDHARVLTGDKPYLDLFLGAVEAGGAARTLARLIVDELRKAGEGVVAVDALVALGERLDSASIPGTAARPVLVELLASGDGVDTIVARLGLEAADSSALEAAVDAVIEANPDEVARFRGGEKRLTGFFIGQVMRAMGGKADGKAVQAVLRAKLG